MNTIIIPVSEKRPEDNIYDLLNILKEEFDGIINISSAVVIETDIPQVAALFQKIAQEGGPAIQPHNNGKGKHACVDCGAPVSKPGKRCRKCAMKIVGENKRHKKEQAAEQAAEQELEAV